MKITLCEDNGALNDGKVTLVCLEIDGKVRIPYEASKTIQELYADVAKINVDAVILGQKPAPLSEVPAIYADKLEEEGVKVESRLINDSIEREDIVVCVETVKDFDDKELEGRDFEVGKEYRVLDIYKSQGQITHYDLINDAKDDSLRIPAFPKEIKLARKKTPQPARAVIMETMKKCGACSTMNALPLIGDQFEGVCEKCGAKLIEARSLNVAA